MATVTNPDPTGAQAQGSSQTGTAGSSGYTSQGYEGSMKQASDVGSEETLSIVQSLVGKDATFLSTLLALNAKRTADEAQSNDMMTRFGDITQRATLNNLATQALQNAIETANLVSKQAVRHSDIAIDREWNLDEQGYQAVEVLRSNTFKDALAAAVAAAVAAALAGKPAA